MGSIVTLQRTHKSWEKASMDVQQTFIFKICSLARKLFNLQYTICKNRFVDQSLFFWKSHVHFISECNPLTMEKNSTNISNFIFIQMKRWDESKNPFSPLFIRGQKTKNASLFCKKNNVLLLWRKEQSYAAKKKNFCWKVIMYLRSVLPIFWRVQFFAGALFSSTTVLYKKLCVCSLLHHFFHFIWSTFKLEST